jgi:hypothetical protein
MIKKFVFLLDAMNLLEKLMEGKRIEGVLFIDHNTGRLTFKGYNRKTSKREKDVIVKKLPWGWVKESMQRIKVFGSFPKDMGATAVMGLMDDHNRSAKNAMIERELVEFC